MRVSAVLSGRLLVTAMVAALLVSLGQSVPAGALTSGNDQTAGVAPVLPTVLPLEGTPVAVNDGGTVLALGGTNDAPLLWNGEVANPLNGLKSATDVNAGGVVAGTACATHCRAALWTDGTVEPLAIAAQWSSFDDSYGKAVNSSGHVAGDAVFEDETGAPVQRAVLWRGGDVVTIPPLAGGGSSYALDLSDAGHVAGASCGHREGAYCRAFVWRDGDLTDLGALAGGASSEAVAVNDAGQVVGRAWLDDGARAVLWQAGAMIDLGAAPGPAAAAHDIDAAGRVVGVSGSSSTAFLWTPAAGLLPLAGTDPAGTDPAATVSAVGMNDVGHVVGYEDVPGESARRQALRWDVGPPAPPERVPPVVTGAVDPAPNPAGWSGAPVTVRWTALDPEPSSGPPTTPEPVEVTAEGAYQVVTSDRSCDPAGNCDTGSVRVSLDLTDPVVTCPAPASAFLLNQRDATLAATVEDVLSGPSEERVSVPVPTSELGTASVWVTGTDRAGRTARVACPYTVEYAVSAAFAGGHIDAPPTVNVVKAGAAVPVTWKLTDANGAPVDDPGSFVAIVTRSTSCSSADEVEVVEASAGESGLQYLGSGTWKFVWKTPSAYRGQCRTARLTLAGGQDGPYALFRFR